MNESIRILFLGANPSDTTRLRLDQEVREIQKAIQRSEFRERFQFSQNWAIRPTDLQEILLHNKPDIVHFSGHGSNDGELILENNEGKAQPVSQRALKQLFSLLKDNIKCVVLNSCYSEAQAQAIAENIDGVVGMSKSVNDVAAITFASAFYQALGFGRDLQTAFDLGCNQIDIESLHGYDTPQLICKKVDPSKIQFVRGIIQEKADIEALIKSYLEKVALIGSDPLLELQRVLESEGDKWSVFETRSLKKGQASK